MSKEKNQSEQKSGGPKIKLPNDIRLNEQLHRKLAEYQERIDEGVGEISPDDLIWKVPEQVGRTSSFFKHAVLAALIKRGEIDTFELSRELGLKNAAELENFEKACGVIKAYVTDGGKNLIGGTGLK